MKPQKALAGVALALALGVAWPAAAQDTPPDPPPPSGEPATREDVQRETEEAVEAVQSYNTARRQAAEERAREAVERMRERMAWLQDEWARERVRYDDVARERRARMLSGARERLEEAQQRSRELEAAGQADWQLARARFIDSYRVLAKDVQGLVERSMPGRPVPPEARSTDDDAADEAEEMRPEDEPHPGDHRDDAPLGATPKGATT